MAAGYRTRMLYADSRVALSNQLQMYLAELVAHVPVGEEVRLITCVPIPPGRPSSETAPLATALGLLVVTLQTGEGD